MTSITQAANSGRQPVASFIRDLMCQAAGMVAASGKGRDDLQHLSARHLRDIGLTPQDVTTARAMLPSDGALDLIGIRRTRAGNW